MAYVDLHVHTPESITQDYTGTDADRWQRFIDELEALPPEVRVLGVNDYWFLDGYRQVREAKASGPLSEYRRNLPGHRSPLRHLQWHGGAH